MQCVWSDGITSPTLLPGRRCESKVAPRFAQAAACELPWPELRCQLVPITVRFLVVVVFGVLRPVSEPPCPHGDGCPSPEGERNPAVFQSPTWPEIWTALGIHGFVGRCPVINVYTENSSLGWKLERWIVTGFPERVP